MECWVTAASWDDQWKKGDSICRRAHITSEDRYRIHKCQLKAMDRFIWSQSTYTAWYFWVPFPKGSFQVYWAHENFGKAPGLEDSDRARPALWLAWWQPQGMRNMCSVTRAGKLMTWCRHLQWPPINILLAVKALDDSERNFYHWPCRLWVTRKDSWILTEMLEILVRSWNSSGNFVLPTACMWWKEPSNCSKLHLHLYKEDINCPSEISLRTIQGW